MKTQIRTKGYIIRSVVYAALLSCVIVGFCSAFNLPNRWSDLSWRSVFHGGITKPARQSESLTFADRVAYQRAIEDVYWRHRNWPSANAGAKPPLDKVMSQTEIEKKVEDYLRNSQALENYWHKPITPEQLQAEMDRVARHTRQPEVLREIFAALGNDPYIIAECLARPALAHRLARNLYAHDERFHGALKQRAQAELANRSVGEMKHTTGTYTEMEWVKSEGESSVGLAFRLPSTQSAGGAPALQQQDASNALKLSNDEWQQNLKKLAAAFGSAKPGRARLPGAPVDDNAIQPPNAWDQIPTNILTPLNEDENAYYATAVISKGKDRLKLATIAWMKQPFDSWRDKAKAQMPVTMAARITSDYTLPAIAIPSVQCTDNTWTATTLRTPEIRVYHAAVWTGSEMIIWGGQDNGTFLNTGGRYDPATDSWTVTSTTNAPDPREYHTAVWSGSRMIVWGGQGNTGFLNTGGRYDPATDSWTATSTTNAPDARAYHTAVWTGSKMIVWGGQGNIGFRNTGGQYDPVRNSWTVTSTTNAPDMRIGHTAVWTGSRMIVWGGYGGLGNILLNTGGRYDPISDSWAATSIANVPEARQLHTAVWTGSRMIVWGGQANLGARLNTGGRYDPVSDSWTATSISNAPTARYYHAGVWAGNRMIVWGGQANSNFVNTGGRYDPATNSWAATSTGNAPDARYFHTAVSTGSGMIVWGGAGGQGGLPLNTGGRYDPATDSWTATSDTPDARAYHTAVWTGSEMIVWGGRGYVGYPVILNTGGRYDPATDNWTIISTANAPVARYYHTAVWTGSQMIVWGGEFLEIGVGYHYLNTGGRYNPNTDSWIATSTTNAPDGRSGHTAVLSGSEMIVWGGQGDNGVVNTGGRYDPGTDSWTATSITNAPDARWYHTAVWTGSEMIVWGGSTCPNLVGCNLGTGGRYNPSTNSWTATRTTNAPDARFYHTALWTGTQMIVWGGVANYLTSEVFNTGARYCAAAPPSPPTAHPATYISSNSFTANWSSVSGATGYRLDVSTNSSFTTYVPGYQNLNVGNATSRSVTGLNPSTTYHYRVRAYNGHGTSGNSNVVNVTTLSPTGPPVAITNTASYIASFSARLNGSVDPHGLTTTIYFQYGTTTSYGLTTAIQSKTGNTYQNVVASVSGLTASTTYHFRIVATNSHGTRYGSDKTFTTLSATGLPVAMTNPATNVARFSATLNGSVDPHGLTTTVHFQYGTTTSYGHTTLNQSKTGNTYQNVAANISGLTPSTTYHFRIVATNSAGTRYGSDRTFTTTP